MWFSNLCIDIVAYTGECDELVNHLIILLMTFKHFICDILHVRTVCSSSLLLEDKYFVFFIFLFKDIIAFIKITRRYDSLLSSENSYDKQSERNDEYLYNGCDKYCRCYNAVLTCLF